MTNQGISDRLTLLRTHLGKSQSAFGEILGVTYATVSRWEKGETPAPEMALIAIETIYGASREWLKTGEGQMLFEPTRIAPPPPPPDFIDRPLIVGAATCGPGGEIQDPGPSATRYSLRKDFAERIFARCGGGSEKDLFYLLCRGESMRPTILDKEIVLLHTGLAQRLEPRSNGIYLVKREPHDTEARVKRIRIDKTNSELILGSDNRAFQPVNVHLEGIPLHQLILGRVVWVGRYLLDTDPPEEDW